MRIHPGLATALLAATALASARAQTVRIRTPIPAATLQTKLDPGYNHPDTSGFRAGKMHDAVLRGLQAGTIVSLPSWTQSFSIQGKTYSYTLVGTDPSLGAATTTIPTTIVPIRLTIPDYLVNGAPLVLDGTQTMRSVLNSPIFHTSNYDSGKNLQFTDAMLHAEFQQAPPGWDMVLQPTIAPTIDVTTDAGKTDVYIAKSGKYAAVVTDNVVDKAIDLYLNKNFAPNTYVIFVTYNALEGGAFGYHDGLLNNAGTALQVYTYTSWLEDVGDVFSLPSPNSDTLAHEAAEVVHDPFITSLTLTWGDWFNKNRCFQKYIEVGDAVEDAAPHIQNTRQNVTVNGKTKKYVVQSEALLPYFTRQSPSPAIHGAYSWPNEKAITGPAPLACAK
jgi:hypothetical protein